LSLLTTTAMWWAKLGTTAASRKDNKSMRERFIGTDLSRYRKNLIAAEKMSAKSARGSYLGARPNT
jgi:hypothetical protein